jgi:hypothetical protein
MIRALVAAAAVAITFSPAAQAVKSASGLPCDMMENATISISFNGIETDVSVVKDKFDAKIAEIKQVAKDMELQKFDLQSMNYNINTQNYGGVAMSRMAMNTLGTSAAPSPQYRFNGSVSFQFLPAEKATELMMRLTKKGYQANLNVNAYHNGNTQCDDSGAVNSDHGAIKSE